MSKYIYNVDLIDNFEVKEYHCKVWSRFVNRLPHGMSWIHGACQNGAILLLLCEHISLDGLFCFNDLSYLI
jgi:hypothetical protein